MSGEDAGMLVGIMLMIISGVLMITCYPEGNRTVVLSADDVVREDMTNHTVVTVNGTFENVREVRHDNDTVTVEYSPHPYRDMVGVLAVVLFMSGIFLCMTDAAKKMGA